MILRFLRCLYRVLIGGKNPVYETMTKVELHGCKVRVWREEKSLCLGPDTEIAAIIRDCIENRWSCREIARNIASLPRVAAVEVLHADGNGLVHYPDWH